MSNHFSDASACFLKGRSRPTRPRRNGTATRSWRRHRRNLMRGGRLKSTFRAWNSGFPSNPSHESANQGHVPPIQGLVPTAGMACKFRLDKTYKQTCSLTGSSETANEQEFAARPSRGPRVPSRVSTSKADAVLWNSQGPTTPSSPSPSSTGMDTRINVRPNTRLLSTSTSTSIPTDSPRNIHTDTCLVSAIATTTAMATPKATSILTSTTARIYLDARSPSDGNKDLSVVPFLHNKEEPHVTLL